MLTLKQQSTYLIHQYFLFWNYLHLKYYLQDMRLFFNEKFISKIKTHCSCDFILIAKEQNNGVRYFPQKNWLDPLRRHRLQWGTRAKRGWGPSAAARTDLGSCRLGNCTFGKLPLGKIPQESCHLRKIEKIKGGIWNIKSFSDI